MVADSVQRLSAEIEALQYDVCSPWRMVKSLWDEGVESVLAGMPARAVTAIMPEGDRFDQGHIDTYATGDRCCDLSYL